MSLRFSSFEQAQKALNGRLKDSDKQSVKVSTLPAKSARRKLQLSRKKVMPQEALFRAISSRFPQEQIESEYCPGVEGRKFRIDVAFPSLKLAVECDGWQYHGKYLDSFSKDRERQNLLVINGWRVLRFTAGDIHKDIETCLSQTAKAIASAKEQINQNADKNK